MIKAIHQQIYQELLLNKETLPALCLKYNVVYATVIKAIRREYPDHIFTYIPNKDVNHAFMGKPYTPNNMYFLGMMLADGWVTGKNIVGLKLKKEDKYLVEKLYKLIKPNQEFKSKTLTISSDQLYKDLCNLGCKPNKTLNKFKLPVIPDNLFFHFLRGYFDGDGSISLRKHRKHQIQMYICSIDEDFLKQIQSKLSFFSISSNIYKEVRNGKFLKLPAGDYKDNCVDMYRLKISGFKNLFRLHENMYKDSDLKMERKYKMFSAYYVNTVLTLEAKYPKAVQRIDNETFNINYDIEMDLAKCYGKEQKPPLKKEILFDLYITQRLPAIKIAKLLNCSRTFVSKWLKEYNLSKSAR